MRAGIDQRNVIWVALRGRQLLRWRLGLTNLDHDYYREYDNDGDLNYKHPERAAYGYGKHYHEDDRDDFQYDLQHDGLLPFADYSSTANVQAGRPGVNLCGSKHPENGNSGGVHVHAVAGHVRAVAQELAKNPDWKMCRVITLPDIRRVTCYAMRA